MKNYGYYNPITQEVRMVCYNPITQEVRMVCYNRGDHVNA